MQTLILKVVNNAAQIVTNVLRIQLFVHHAIQTKFSKIINAFLNVVIHILMLMDNVNNVLI